MQVLTAVQVEQPAGHPRQTPLTLKVLAMHARQFREASQVWQLLGHWTHLAEAVIKA